MQIFSVCLWKKKMVSLCNFKNLLAVKFCEVCLMFHRLVIYQILINFEIVLGNTQLALQIIKRNQLLPSVKMLSEIRKKPVFQPPHLVQPIQMPTFTTVQRK
uniref:Uncharacterized protein n=1 Tax=Micrurus paraensis TaxID=1970185 RepID=A0A2D4JX72_9SAUR